MTQINLLMTMPNSKQLLTRVGDAFTTTLAFLLGPVFMLIDTLTNSVPRVKGRGLVPIIISFLITGGVMLLVGYLLYGMAGAELILVTLIVTVVLVSVILLLFVYMSRKGIVRM